MKSAHSQYKSQSSLQLASSQPKVIVKRQNLLGSLLNNTYSRNKKQERTQSESADPLSLTN